MPNRSGLELIKTSPQQQTNQNQCWQKTISTGKSPGHVKGLRTQVSCGGTFKQQELPTGFTNKAEGGLGNEV